MSRIVDLNGYREVRLIKVGADPAFRPSSVITVPFNQVSESQAKHHPYDTHYNAII